MPNISIGVRKLRPNIRASLHTIRLWVAISISIHLSSISIMSIYIYSMNPISICIRYRSREHHQICTCARPLFRCQCETRRRAIVLAMIPFSAYRHRVPFLLISPISCAALIRHSRHRHSTDHPWRLLLLIAHLTLMVKSNSLSLTYTR